MSSSTVDSISPAFQQQRASMQICHDLMGGTESMVSAGRRYIMQEPGEDDASWNIRVKRTVLLNVFARTLRYMGGRVFQKAVAPGEDFTDEAMLALLEDVDKQGRNITVWSRRVFEAGLRDGVTYAVVDFASVPTRRGEAGQTQYQRPDGTWADKTEAADRDNGWRPYFIHVEAGQVLDCRVEWADSSPRVTHFRYIETLEEPDGAWGTQTYQQIRAFFYDDAGRAVWQVYRNEGTGLLPSGIPSRATSSNFTLTASGVFSIGVLPVCIFMPGEERTLATAAPALIDLAHLNRRHWQATSEQYELMSYVRRPPWFGKKLGFRDPDTGKTVLSFGPGVLCHSEEDTAELSSVGVDPGSVAAGRQELQDLENSMALYGLQLLQPKTGVITATESNRDAEESNSTLKAWALDFQDFLENCLLYVARWLGQEQGPSVVVNTDFASAFDASFLLELNRAGVLSGESLLGLVKNMGVLPDDFDVEGEASRLATGVMVNGSAGGSGALERFMQSAGQL